MKAGSQNEQEGKLFLVSKWAVGFLVAAVVLGIFFGLRTLRSADEDEQRAMLLQGVPAPPELEGMPARLASALASAYSRIRYSDDGRTAVADLGRLYQANGFNRQARVCFETLASIEADRADWSLYLAALSEDFGDPSLEIGHWEAAREKGDASAHASLSLAKAYARSGHAPRALAVLEDLLVEDPENRFALIEVGRIHLEAENFAEASLWFERAMALDPGYRPVYEFLEDAYGGMGDLRRYELKFKASQLPEMDYRWADPLEDELLEYCVDPLALVSAAERQESVRRFGDAIALAAKALRLEPGWIEARLALGRLYLKKGDARQSVEVLSVLAENEEGGHLPYVGLAEAYLELGLLAEGIRAVESGLGERPRSSELNLWAGRLYEASGDRSAAVASYEAALAIDSGDPQVLGRLGFLLLGDGDGRGLRLLERRIFLRPEDVASRLAVGLAYLEADQGEAAVPFLEGALRYEPDNEAVRTALSRIENRQR